MFSCVIFKGQEHGDTTARYEKGLRKGRGRDKRGEGIKGGGYPGTILPNALPLKSPFVYPFV
jgi:hypothetical protein